MRALFPRPLLRVDYQGIVRCLGPEGEELPEGLGGVRAADALLRAAGVVVSRREIAVCGIGFEFQRGGLPLPADASVELRVGFGKAFGGQVGAAQIEATDPGVYEFLRLHHQLDRLRKTSLLEREIALNELAVRLLQ